MTAIPLSAATVVRLEHLFAGEARIDATRLLCEECGANLPFCESLDAVGLERQRYAALKVSRGDLHLLRQAVDVAKTDWRDLLVAAGFADDAQAHTRWMPGARTV